MELNDFLRLIRRKIQTIITLVLVGTMITVLVSLLFPLKYGVNSRLLVTQDSTNTDAYALSRSNEYLGKLLAEVVYSGSFYDKVINSKYGVDQNYFNGDYGEQLKTWKKTVSTRTLQDTGIIEVNVYHTQVLEAKKINLAINDILINNNSDYHGGTNIKINVIDQPLASNYPIKPNLPSNAGIAAITMFLFSLFYIYLFPEDKYSLYLFSGKKAKKKVKKQRRDKKDEERKNEDKEDENKKDEDDKYLKGSMHNIIR